MMELKEDIDWLLSKNNSLSNLVNKKKKSISVNEEEEEGEEEEEEEEEEEAEEEDEDYNPPSMETNFADLEEGKEVSQLLEVEDDDDDVDDYPLLGPRLEVEAEESDKVDVGVPGVCGLRNLGNTCYLNAGLQCLLATPSLIHYFNQYAWKGSKEHVAVSEEHLSEDDPAVAAASERVLASSFSSLLSQVWRGESRVLKPLTFKEKLSRNHPQFKGSHQHDCQEFLALTLDSLHEELKSLPHPQQKSTTPSYLSSSSSPDSQSSSEQTVPEQAKTHLSSIRARPLPHHISYLSTRFNIEDYLKENKTSNVNVNSPTPDGNMNNALNFDSEKYASKEKNRPESTINNLSPKLFNHLGKEDECRSGGKRFKESNLLKISEGVEEESSGMKRMRLDSSEKNAQLEWERSASTSTHLEEMANDNVTSVGASVSSSEAQVTPLDSSKLNETIEADRVWDKYLSENDTVIARNFHGQFKNKVVCSVCDHISVTFEPFMYLSVPLPGALTRQVDLIFIGRASIPIRLRLNMTRVDNVGALKSRLKDILQLEESSKLQIVEVFDHHISRHVEDWTALKFLKEDREIYALELIEAEDHFDSDDRMDEPEGSPEESLASQDYETCIICMEDLPPGYLRQHNACDCVICKSCMDRTIEHHQKEYTSLFGQIKCPGCRIEADPETEFVTLDKIGRCVPKKRILNLPVLYRLDNSEEKDNNKKTVEPIGHPFVLTLPNIVSGKKMYELLDPLVRSIANEEYTLVLVNAQGKKCARCIFHAHCYGCIRLERNSTARIYLQPNDTIGVSFTSDSVVAKLNSLKDHDTMFENPKIRDKLCLTDCLQAFSEKEVLDENNPWFCSQCQKNQCATKTLTIWRFPDYLIIYLKRFVYLPGTAGAVKLETPVDFNLNSFELTQFLSGPMPEVRPRFDLYGLVNHFGSVCGGHYTSFTKKDQQWNYFDDCSVTEKKVPGSCSGDFSSAYVLFYKRSGIPAKSLRQDLSSRIMTSKFNLDSLN